MRVFEYGIAWESLVCADSCDNESATQLPASTMAELNIILLINVRSVRRLTEARLKNTCHAVRDCCGGEKRAAPAVPPRGTASVNARQVALYAEEGADQAQPGADGQQSCHR